MQMAYRCSGGLDLSPFTQSTALGFAGHTFMQVPHLVHFRLLMTGLATRALLKNFKTPLGLYGLSGERSMSNESARNWSKALF
jgi:hypothetical protein